MKECTLGFILLQSRGIVFGPSLRADIGLFVFVSAMESPFRAMDEFDVFMDAVNRHMSLKLLIESAREQKHRQFIFITPHDLTSVAAGPDVRVNRMRDPERNIGGPEQTTLDQLIQS